MHELTDTQIKELEKTQFLVTEDLKAEKIREERRIIHWISTPDLDRGRDIMMPKGMIFDGFLKTKTVFADHQYDRPIGSNVKLAATNDGVRATTYFTDKTEFANDRYHLHLEGVINTWSIGFKAVRDKEGRIEEGSIEFDEKNNKRIFHKSELLEYSDTGIPMNPDCLDIAKSICKSMESKQEIETLELRMLINTSAENFKKEIAELKSALEQKDLTSKELKEEINKIHSALEKLVGNKSVKPIDADSLRKAIRQHYAGLFNQMTGRKLKS